MNIPKEAIEKAIEGGWMKAVIEKNNSLPTWPDLTDEGIALDPSFWQSLGKALGWDEEGAIEIFEKNKNARKAKDRFEIRTVAHWYHYAFEFYNLILTGQPTDEYWKQLLS